MEADVQNVDVGRVSVGIGHNSFNFQIARDVRVRLFIFRGGGGGGGTKLTNAPFYLGFRRRPPSIVKYEQGAL